jgi:hypothetical protein
MRLFYLVAFIIFVAACQSRLAASPSENAGQTSLKSGSTPELEAAATSPSQPADCPGLDSRLFQLTRAAEPLKLANQWQLKLKDGKVQVLLILADEDVTFLKNFDVEPGTQAGAKIQVFAPIPRLCDLANSPQVLTIRPPTQVFIQ